MARYAALLGHRVEVHYRCSGEILLPATGTLAADSGKSIFLEEVSWRKPGQTVRWEIPYSAIIRVSEALMPLLQ